MSLIQFSCGSCSHVAMTPKGLCCRLDILIHLAAWARSLGSAHRSHHFCWNGEKPEHHNPPQFTLESRLMGVLVVCSALKRIIFCFYLIFVPCDDASLAKNSRGAFERNIWAPNLTPDPFLRLNVILSFHFCTRYN